LFIYKPSKSQLTSHHNTPTEATDQLKMEGLVKLFSLSGKTAVVTGGTRGIGAAMAVALAEAGADIILVQVRD
jgi:NADP-dependent 3-hydroxy acid dehydrogenase YdfG